MQLALSAVTALAKGLTSAMADSDATAADNAASAVYKAAAAARAITI
jgi:hypothetical protein